MNGSAGPTPGAVTVAPVPGPRSVPGANGARDAGAANGTSPVLWTRDGGDDQKWSWT
ncbi:hypothetical protein [Streptomyces sp. NPDC058964]|uniref:hypothetical protein n=1 Tax=Streptomyces sp. NPDC058964 TaxID=3346681 RepID=UPI0036A68DAC